MGQVFKSHRFGNVKITPIANASIIIECSAGIIHIDPYGNIADYSKLPKADLILTTHHHFDHFDSRAIDKIRKENTHIIANELSAEIIPSIEILHNGELTSWCGVKIETVPAYNFRRGWSEDVSYHPKGECNGYIITIDQLRIYIAGDTELIEEMRAIKNIDIAFLPKMAPYTMTDDEFYEAARIISPKYLFPYHFMRISRADVREKLPNITIL